MRHRRLTASLIGVAGIIAARRRSGSDARPVRAGVASALRRAPAVSAWAEKNLWRVVYDAANRGGRGRETALMNYGYAPRAGSSVGSTAESAADPDRFGVEMYARVAGAVDLWGKDVLEVGCGRGGGAAFVLDRFSPRSVAGIDLAKRAIQRCEADHQRAGLTFLVGDAERLPFPDGAFDVLLNIESSHCYPDTRRFLGEAHRVLRPGGHLLLADFRHTSLSEKTRDMLLPQEDVAVLRRQIREAGLLVVEEEDITPNVMRALTLDSARRRARLEQRVPAPFRRHAVAFSGVEGSGFYRAYAEGRMTYLRFVLRKPDDADGNRKSD